MRNSRASKRRLLSLWIIGLSFCLFLALLIEFGHAYRNQGLIDRALWRHIRDDFPVLLKSVFVQTPRVLFQTETLSREKIKLPQIELIVPASSERALEANPPKSFRQYQRAYLKTEGEVYRVKARYRGDTPNHWGSRQKSWKIRLTRGKLLNGARHINIINPEDYVSIRNTVGDQLAKDLDLLAPESGLLHFRLNNENFGPMFWTEQINEYFLRRRGLHPGNIYSGEGYYKDGSARNKKLDPEIQWLWFSPKGWYKSASRSPEAESDRSDIETLIRFVTRAPDDVFFEYIWDFFDRDELLRFFALHNGLATMHTDEFHNWKLYMDPALGKFRPIPWDLHYCVYPEGKRVFLDIVTTLLQRRLYQDASFRDSRDRMVWNMIQPGEALNLDLILARFNEKASLLRPSVAPNYNNDYLKDFFPQPYTVSDFDRDLERTGKCLTYFHQGLFRELKSSEMSLVVYPPRDPSSTLQFDLVHRGHSTTLLKKISFLLPEAKKIRAVKLIEDLDADGIATPRDKELASLKLKSSSIHLDLRGLFSSKREVYLPDGMFKGTEQLRKKDTRFALLLDFGKTLEPKALLEIARTLTFQARNHITSAPVKIQAFPHQPDYEKWVEENPRGKVRFEKELPKRMEKVLRAGNHYFKKNLFLKPRETLIIKAGANLFLGPGVSIISQAPIEIQGKKGRPVTISPLKRGQNWGSIIVQGGLNNQPRSIIRHAKIRGGSSQGFKLNFYDCMICVFRGDLEIEDSEFSDNTSEDLINVKFGNLQVSNSNLFNSHSDAIDVDYGSLEIFRSNFANLGNDALDLSGTRAKIEKVYVSSARDKAFSVGEKSELDANSSLIEEGATAIAVKDGSKLTLRNSIILQTKKGVSAYRKNLHYDRDSKIILVKSYFLKTERPIEAGRKTSFNLLASRSDSTKNFVFAPDPGTTKLSKEKDKKARKRVKGVLQPLDKPEEDLLARWKKEREWAMKFKKEEKP